MRNHLNLGSLTHFHRISGSLGGCFRHQAVNTLLLVIVSTLAACGSNKKREESGYRLRLGTSYLTQGNYPAALRELLKAEELSPDNELIQNNLGLSYFMRGKYDLAARHLERAMRLNPKFTEARNNYARTLIELTRYDEAIRELDVVLADLTYEEPVKAWINLGLAYFRKGQYGIAREKFLEAVRLDRANCLAQNYFGRSLLELGEHRSAARALDNAVAICAESKFDEPYYFSGLSYYKLGNTSAAVARMEEVTKLYPHGPYAKKAESLLKLMK